LQAKPVQKFALWREIKRNRVAYVYVAPFLILFLVFGLYPIVSGLYISFFRWDGLGAMRYRGLDNYTRIFTDPQFLLAMKNTLYIGLISHVPILGGGMVVAYVLNGRFIKGNNLFKTIYFLPMVTSAVAVTIVFQTLFGFNFGLLNYFLSRVGLPMINWLGGKGEHVKTAIIIMFSWKWIGWNMVIYTAGMQGIGTELYEAATIDGACPSQVFFRITLPLLKPIILFTLIQSSIGTVNLFTEPFVLTGGLGGGTNNQGLTMMMYMLNKAPRGNNVYGVAAAVAYVITVIVIMLSLTFQSLLGNRERRARRERL